MILFQSCGESDTHAYRHTPDTEGTDIDNTNTHTVVAHLR